MIPVTLLALTLCAAPTESVPERPPGAFGLGLRLNVGVGVVEALAAGGAPSGLVPRIGLEYELAPGISVAAGARLQRGIVDGEPTFARVGADLGARVRWRTSGRRFAAGLGLGLQIGGFSASRELLGLGHSDDRDAQALYGFPVAPFGQAFFEWQPFRPLAFSFGVVYAPVFFEAAMVHSLEEMLTVELCF